PLLAQVVKGSISGTVTDPQGAVVSGATVKAINDATGATLTTTSDSSGSFHFNLIPVGTYKVEMTAAGFKTTVQNNIVVAAGRNNDQQIDGQNNNDNSVSGPGLFLSDTEFVQQYILVTSQFGPEYGRNAGSVVNIITKSGSNAWHGSIYEHENNTVLNSMTNFQ